MHLSQRAYVFLMLIAVLAVAGIWSTEPALADLWRIPAVLLLMGLAMEGLFIRRALVSAEIETASCAFLGREQDAAYAFHNGSSRAVRVEYAPMTPIGVEPLGNATREIVMPAGGVGRDPFTLLAIRMGPQAWPALPARLLGPLGLAWWSRDFRPSLQIAVAPDTLVRARGRPRGNPAGARPRRVIGAGSELHQLRGYVRGDSLARIDWKATARAGRLVTREFSEDQHLDVLVAIDAGRLSRVRAGRLDRFGVYANVMARFAEIVVPNDDRIGMIVFAGSGPACGDAHSQYAGAVSRAVCRIRSSSRRRAYPRHAETSGPGCATDRSGRCQCRRPVGTRCEVAFAASSGGGRRNSQSRGCRAGAARGARLERPLGVVGSAGA
jgi:uncharacterized protein (DUF58 family)